MKTLIAMTTFAVAAAAPALAETSSFQHEGDRYTYEVTQKADAQLITGRNLSTGQRFVLRVRNDRVSGVYDGARVSFPVAKADVVKIAAR